jgi:hypothetical protein
MPNKPSSWAGAERRSSTYVDRALADAENLGGRFGRVRTGPLIVGATPIPNYPKGADWCGADQTPAETIDVGRDEEGECESE